MKRILDACCGSKMFWFEKDNPDVEFCDIREMERTEYYPERYIEISPDTVYDPPHLEYAGDTSIMALKYGKLKGDWKAMLSKGFDECMRVLKPNGVLIFKWSEIQFPLSVILPLFSQKPLFGNRCRKRGNKTHWLCFMKDN